MSRALHTIKKNDAVFHRKLEADGIVLEAMANGRYRVGIGSLIVECKASDLVLQKHGPTAHTKKPGETHKASTSSAGKPSLRSSSVDLHGLTVEEAIATLNGAIDRALRGGSSSLTIIHGHGSGRVKSAVQRFLKTLSVVKNFKLDERNSGATVAYF